MIWLKLILVLILCDLVNCFIPLRNEFDLFEPRLSYSKTKKLNRFASKLPKDGPVTNDKIERVAQVFRYELQITPNMKFNGLDKGQDRTFDAKMQMFFQITNLTNYLPLRSENLNIKTVHLRETGSMVDLILNAFETNYDTTNAKVIPLDGFDIGQNYTLFVEYSGQIYDGGNQDNWPEGLYYDNYYDENAQLKQVVATFFEPTNSRKVFPNLDDPHFKAVFSLSLIYPTGLKVYANTEIIKTGSWDNKGNVIAQFADTPLISSYLFAFSLGDFAEAQNQTISGVNVKAMAIKHLNAGLQNAANIGAGCINAMEDFTKVKYPLNKLDNVDMLTMGYAEAMENLGMIVYAKNLISNPSIANVKNRILASTILCHEIGHQWFGDLVTADFWGVEFLHESFANFFENRAFQWQLSKEDNDYMETNFVQSRDDSLYIASLDDAHPVVDTISNFDGITYMAGGAILRMLEGALGSPTFYKALNIYLTKNAYANADQNTLINAFEEALDNEPVCGDLRITQVMNDFLLQTHYPVVTVTVKNNNFEFSQHSSNATDDLTTWNIPLFVWEAKTQKTNVIWLLDDSSICTNDDFELDSNTVYVFNKGAYAFARVQYSFVYSHQLFLIDSSLLDGGTQMSLFYDQYYKEDDEGDSSTRGDRLSSRLLKKFMEEGNGKVNPHIISLFKSVYPKDNLTSYNVYQNIDLNTKTLIGGMYNSVLYLKAIKNNIGTFKQDGQVLFNQFFNDCKNAKMGALVTCNKILPDARALVYCAGMYKNHRSTIFMKKYKYDIEKASIVYPYLSDEIKLVKSVIENCGY